VRACVLGVIIFYELWLKAADAASRARLVFNPSGQFDPLGRPTVLPPPETNYTVHGLQPFTRYQLQVVAENALGKTASDFATGRTAEAGTHCMHVGYTGSGRKSYNPRQGGYVIVVLPVSVINFAQKLRNGFA